MPEPAKLTEPPDAPVPADTLNEPPELELSADVPAAKATELADGPLD
jgi:hypothetical protein